MKLDQRQTSGSTSSLKGVCYTLVPAPLLLTCRAATTSIPPFWSLMAALGAALSLLGLALLCELKPKFAKLLGFVALIGCALSGLDYFASEPLLALLGGVALIQVGYFLVDLPCTIQEDNHYRENSYFFSTAKKSLLTLAGLATLSFLLNPSHLRLGEQAIAIATLICQIPVALWLRSSPKISKKIWWWLLPLLTGILTAFALTVQLTALAALLSSIFSLWFLPRDHRGLIEHPEQWWEPFLNHPARVLISTFFGLCLLGTMLLQLPWAASGRPLSLINAAFTSVSAVCVTGLTVVDTQMDFTPFGQGCILLLIQLGGLGIMTITTVALHAMGKRLSLRQERLLTTLTETSHQELIFSLVTIVRFTLVVEGLGAMLLTIGYGLAGTGWADALWKGLFTSISAFCNAGFALDSTNLLPYQHQPFILHTVAILIILGGLAPSTCMLVSRWIRGRRIELAPRIALVTTSVLLFVGTCSFLIFEWDHALGGLDVVDKLHNAWFQSVTLRTAGFNSVD
ncbi:MAG: potassium transporter TrkG, partial [Desulfobulbus sp.]